MSEQLEQIHQLLDGDLDSIHESALYAELAVNDDLREEMREQMALKSAVNDDRMALVPPAALTNSVFTGLGFTAPLASSAAGTAGGGMLMQWVARLGIPVLGAIAAAGITFGVTNNEAHAPGVSSPKPLTNQDVTSSEAVTGPVTEAPQVAPQIVERIIERPADPTTAKQLAFYKRESERLKGELARSQARIDELEAQRDIANASSADVAETPDQTPTLGRQLAYSEPAIQQLQITNSYDLTRQPDIQRVSSGVGPINYYQVQYPAYSAQIRGFSLTPTVQTDVNAEREWYSDIGVSMLYQVDQHNAFSIEVGNESYPMVFEGDRNGQIVRYDQNPSTIWAGIGYRYTGNNFGDLPIAPYGQAMLGGATYGPIGRASAGLQYSPAGPLTFILGLEGSALIYRHQDNFHVSPKVGLTYGMAVRF